MGRPRPRHAPACQRMGWDYGAPFPSHSHTTHTRRGLNYHPNKCGLPAFSALPALSALPFWFAIRVRKGARLTGCAGGKGKSAAVVVEWLGLALKMALRQGAGGSEEAKDSLEPLYRHGQRL